ncbi:hypothetical protein EC968_006894 [Mortierella alpina]|nr:hypothetical protein EC968_006894 [Mortierella alpina]
MLVYIFILFQTAIVSFFLGSSNAEPPQPEYRLFQDLAPKFSMPLMRDPLIKHNTSAQVSKMHARYRPTSKRRPIVPLVKARGAAFYSGSISVGEPQQFLNVIFSLDSVYTWLASAEYGSARGLQGKRYNYTSSVTHKLDKTAWGDYAYVYGTLCSDIVRVGDVPVRLTFGETIFKSEEMKGADVSGILGLAPYAKGGSHKSFIETAVEHQALDKPAPDGSVSGEISLDGFDDTKFDPPLAYANVIGQYKQSSWRVPVDFLPSNNATLHGLSGEAVFDLKQELISVPEQFATEFYLALGGYGINLSRSKGYWCLPCPQCDTANGTSLGTSTMDFRFGNTTLQMPLTELLGERCIGSGYYKPRFQITENPFWILGQVFFRHFYCVFDNDTIPPRVGVAPLKCVQD